MRRRDLLIKSSQAVLGFCLAPLAARAQGTPNSARSKEGAGSLIAELERLIPKLMEEAVVPGVSIAVIQDAKLIWRRGFGFKDSTSKDPVDDDTVFETASVSKTVFAYAVMKLCENGVLDLDTPLTKYTPNRPLDDPRVDLITARHVLSHTTGFQDWRSKEEPLKFHFTPGERFLYSGEGYNYLQSVVTHLTGHVNPEACAEYEAGLRVCATDFDPFMKRTLLAPFGMASSGYLWNEIIEKHAARPHDLQGKPIEKGKPTAMDVARYGSAGGLLATATDYAKFLLEVIDPKESDASRLSKKSLAEMLRPQVKLEEGQKINDADFWALGWAIQQRPSGAVFLHSGGQSGFQCLTMASVERKSGFVVLTNGNNGWKLLYHEALTKELNRLFAA